MPFMGKDIRFGFDDGHVALALPGRIAVFKCPKCSKTHFNMESPLGIVMMLFDGPDADEIAKALADPPRVTEAESALANMPDGASRQ